jgi:transcriptional regulator with XRE-family HTH domain
MAKKTSTNPKTLRHRLTFGQVLRELREEKGLSQEALADASELHRTWIGMLERGMKLPTLVTLTKLSKGLELPAHKIVAKFEAAFVEGLSGRRSP